MTDDSELPLALPDVHRMVGDLMRCTPLIYFADFTASAAIGYGAAWVYFTAPLFSLRLIVCFLVAGFALFRAGVFMHEIVHMPSGRMTAFKVYWNVCYGVPLMAPAFMYTNHRNHHNQHHYGTPQDGEYQPFAAGPASRVWLYFAEILVLPLLGLMRFLVLAPASAFSGRLRRWTLERASSYVSNPGYRLRVAEGERRLDWLAVEMCCCIVCVALVAALWLGYIHWPVLVRLYALSVFGISLNWLRNLAGHRFLSDGASMEYLDQFHESITIIGHPWLHELLFPVGLRYHALHHLLPGMPYHNLGIAHRRLVAELPATSSYRRTLYSGLGEVLGLLFASIRARDALVASIPSAAEVSRSRR